MYAVIAPNMGKQIVALQARVLHTRAAQIDGDRRPPTPDVDTVARLRRGLCCRHKHGLMFVVTSVLFCSR